MKRLDYHEVGRDTLSTAEGWELWLPRLVVEAKIRLSMLSGARHRSRISPPFTTARGHWESSWSVPSRTPDSRSRPLWQKKQCQQSYPVPTYRRTTPRFPESLYANKHAQAQPSGERLGQASWPFAVDAADEGRTKLFLTADSAPRWMRDRKGIGRVVFRQPPVFDWMSGNFSVTPGF